MKQTVAVCLLFTALAGCASTGVQVKQSQLADFKTGITTEAEVIQRLGKPNTSMLNYDGSRTLIYSYSQYQTRPTSFIPVVGLFAGGADIQMNTTMLRFDKDGKLLNMTASESQYGSGTGLTAGRPIPQSDQPRQQPTQ